MTEKKIYCFKWRGFYVKNEPPYNASAIGEGSYHSITRSKAYYAAWRAALDSLKLIYPDSHLCGDLLPRCYRSQSSYRCEYHADDGHTYYLYVDEVTA